MGPGVRWFESCSVGLVWSGGYSFSSFPCSILLFLQVFCVKHLGLDDRSMRFTGCVGDLTLHRIVIGTSAKTRFAKHLCPCFWALGCLNLVLLAWCGLGTTVFGHFLVWFRSCWRCGLRTFIAALVGNSHRRPCQKPVCLLFPKYSVSIPPVLPFCSEPRCCGLFSPATMNFAI